MGWFFGILFLGTAIAWLWRERAQHRNTKHVHTMLDDLAHGREPLSFGLDGTFARLGQRARQVAAEHEHLRRQRQLAEANLQIILSSMQEGVLVVDSRRAIRLVNPSLRKMFALPPNIFGQPVIETLKEPVVDQMITAALASGQAQEREIALGRKPAATLMVNVSPMRDAAGEAGALAMFRDVTRLTQLEQVRREFVANVSHELRTPLAIFQGYVENLVDNPDMPRDDRAEVYGVLEKHSQRLNALVEDLLILARLEGRHEEIHREPLEIADILAETARDWALRMSKKNLTLKLEVAPGLPPVSGDRMRLEQVLNNLLDNAVKYTPAGKAITLGAARGDRDIELWVQDTGPGILSTELPHIFERFYRADKARSRELGGTGLGLSIVKHIAQAHGGSVVADSTFGKGTTVRVRLPIGPDAESETTSNAG
jgi:two-component system, OmpR family, phosphate regulon sensor histidine kinase PhoR